MKRTQITKIAFLSSVITIYLAGCGNKFFDPTQIGRFRPTPAVNVILDSLGVAEEPSVAWDKAEDPRPSDIVAVETDYRFMSGDVLRVAIFELFQDGISVVSNYVVTETGKVSIPDVGVVQAAGLTETQLEDEIKQILSPSILKEPSVTVTLITSQQRTFSILGDGVMGPGRYVIPRYDYRLADALATAGGPRQFNVSYIFVSRSAKAQKASQAANPVESVIPQPKMSELQTIGPGSAKREAPEPGILRSGITEPRAPELEREMLEITAPMAKLRWPASKKLVIASTELARDREFGSTALPGRSRPFVNRRPSWVSAVSASELAAGSAGQDVINEQIGPEPILTLPSEPTDGPETVDEGGTGEEIEWIFQDGKWVPVQVTPPEPTLPTLEEEEEEEVTGRIEWIFKDGQWVPIQVGPPKPEKPPIKIEPKGPIVPLEERLEKPPVELEWEEAVQARLIRIPADKLLGGDPRYNIVIKPGDTIHVPVDIIGEFCIMGNVNRTGYINITGRPMTLKMAIAAAGGLGPLAWPKTCEVVRRIGRDKEEVVMVDLDKIASGEQPDFFIKPNDLVNVGTHVTSRWRAILRNAFRATYGFGFVYDRNFAYQDYYGTRFNPIWPWDWDKVF